MEKYLSDKPYSTTTNEFTFEVTDRLIYQNKVDISYNVNYLEQDFAKSSSYKLNTSTAGLGIGYDINPKLRHKINLSYALKDYIITNSSTVDSKKDKFLTLITVGLQPIRSR